MDEVDEGENRQRTRRITLGQRLRYRLWSLPRGGRETDRSLMLLGAFRRLGWHTSVRLGAPADRDGSPLPWFTYPAIYWLEGVLQGSERVLEFGCGNSTLWLSSRAASVTSIEHDERWARRISARAPENARVLQRICHGDEQWAPADDPYVRSLAEEAATAPFDVIVVDGRARNSCLLAAAEHLATNGIIVLDDSDRPEYRPALDKLRLQGFGRLDFTGPVPGEINIKSTSAIAREIDPWLRRAAYPRVWGTTIPEYGVLS